MSSDAVSEPSLFSRIIDGEIPADFVYQDDVCVAFRDVSPQAPTHVLIVPREPLDCIGHARDEQQDMLGHLMLVAGKVARELGCDDAFRLVINHGAGVGQSVFHLHVHLLAGRAFDWPPG